MTLRPPTENVITPAQMGLNIAARAYTRAEAIRAHWLASYDDMFGQPDWTVADLQAAVDAVDDESIAQGEGRAAFGLFVAHNLQQQVLRTSLPPEDMADDPTQSPVPYTIEFDNGYTPPTEDPASWDTTKVRIVFDANAKYPTEENETGSE